MEPDISQGSCFQCLSQSGNIPSFDVKYATSDRKCVRTAVARSAAEYDGWFAKKCKFSLEFQFFRDEGWLGQSRWMLWWFFFSFMVIVRLLADSAHDSYRWIGCVRLHINRLKTMRTPHTITLWSQNEAVRKPENQFAIQNWQLQPQNSWKPYIERSGHTYQLKLENRTVPQ